MGSQCLTQPMETAQNREIPVEADTIPGDLSLVGKVYMHTKLQDKLILGLFSGDRRFPRIGLSVGYAFGSRDGMHVDDPIPG